MRTFCRLPAAVLFLAQVSAIFLCTYIGRYVRDVRASFEQDSASNIYVYVHDESDQLHDKRLRWYMHVWVVASGASLSILALCVVVCTRPRTTGYVHFSCLLPMCVPVASHTHRQRRLTPQFSFTRCREVHVIVLHVGLTSLCR